MKFGVLLLLLLSVAGFKLVRGYVSDNGSIITVPLLFDPEDSCSSDDDGTSLFGFTLVPQNHKTFTAEVFFYNNTAPSRCYSFSSISWEKIDHYLYGRVNFNSNRSNTSWQELCEKNMFGIAFKLLDNPGFAAVAVLLTQQFQISLVLYPTPTTTTRSSTTRNYTYYIVHGRHYSEVMLIGGFTIQNPYDKTSTSVTMNLTNTVIGWKDGSELVTLNATTSIELRCKEVIWAEPGPDTDDSPSLSLTGSVLVSATPINVFTNVVRAGTTQTHRNDTGNDTDTLFNYNSQVLHQMPEKMRWGKTFVIDLRYSKMFPDNVTRSCSLLYEVLMVSHASDNLITLKNNLLPQGMELRAPERSLQRDYHEYRISYSQAAKTSQLTYLEIVSDSPIFVLLETYTTINDSCLVSLYYSTVVQPVEWFANKQISVLVHPLPQDVYSYHVTVVVSDSDVENEAGHPGDSIIESEEEDYCKGSPITKLHKIETLRGNGSHQTLLAYNVQIEHPTSNVTRVLLRHSNPLRHIGVTVYAYSQSLQSSYSNGYSLVNATSDDAYCSNFSTPPSSAASPSSSPSFPSALVLSCSCVMALLVLTAAVGVAVKTVMSFLKRRRKRRSREQSYYTVLPSSMDCEYLYDVFILCADEDESFVKECIEEPLKEYGFTTLTKNTAAAGGGFDGLFMPGNEVASDMDRVVRLCSHVIVVSSENYSSERNCCRTELSYCRELMAASGGGGGGAGRVIPVVLDQKGADEFAGFTQHRISSAEVSSDADVRCAFIRKLKCHLTRCEYVA